MFDRRRPDPAQGVFETMLVLGGHPVELDAHLARLESSLAELYPAHDPPPLDVPVERGPYGPLSTGTSVGGGLGALRIMVSPGSDGELAATVAWRDAPGAFFPDIGSKAPGPALSLHSLRLPGGLGAHKWADRSLLDEAQDGLPKDSLPLILDQDGTVLEASRANVFAVRDGMLITPPTDGRILPGVTRMRVLEIAGGMGIDSSEAALHRDDLFALDEVFLTGSVQGIERVCALDGAPLPADGDIAACLGAKLRQAWAGAPTAA